MSSDDLIHKCVDCGGHCICGYVWTMNMNWAMTYLQAQLDVWEKYGYERFEEEHW